MKRVIYILLLVFSMFSSAYAQEMISGHVIDEEGYAIPHANIRYKGLNIKTSSDIDGSFTIKLYPGSILTITCMGYKSQSIKMGADPQSLEIKLKEDSHRLNEVVVRSSRQRYRRKDNPAVELMRRVIAAKKHTRLENHDYYRYDRYQKIMFAFNDLKAEQLQSSFFTRRPYLLDQVERSPYNGKLTLPVSVDETLTQHIYRRTPRDEKDIIKGQRSNGIGKVIQTGEMLNSMLKEYFTDVDIYDDYIRLMQFPFVSPIGKTAISFYHFYIEDTVYVDRDLCFHLQFIPANQQDFGFRGELYVVADTTLHVKKCNLYIPKKSDVNWIDDMKIEQEFSKLPDGEWVLTKDDMIAEIHATDLLQDLLVVRNTRLSDYAFDELPSHLFRGKAKVRHEAEALNRDEAFWDKYRGVSLTRSEASMGDFIHRMEKSKGWKWIISGVRVLMENYVETGDSSKFDIGPVNTFLSRNYIDDIRLRLAGRTMAALNAHWFWDGYAAYGTKSKRWYYGSEITYALNKKKASPFEFPQRNIVFESTYDVMSPSDRNLVHNKDNIFMTFRAATQDQMYFYNRQRLSLNYETDWGLRYNLSLQRQVNQTAGNLHYYRLDGEEVKKIRMTDATIGITYNPGVTYINTKQQRLPINLDSPRYFVSHTVGFDHLLGGQFHSNITTIGFYKRQWLGSWGHLDVNANAKAQWNKVPFPMLLLPPINLSFFEHETSFNLMRDWEFLNDRQVFWAVHWDLNGKVLNRIPIIRQLKWREIIGIKGMWGTLTNKNNPFLQENLEDPMLYKFPKASKLMTNQPYWEVVAGVHNILKFFSVVYVRRLTYLETCKSRWGVRFGFKMSF